MIPTGEKVPTSPRGARSHTRRLTREFVDLWENVSLGDTTTYRDIGFKPPPPVDEGWIAAAFTAPEDRTPRTKGAAWAAASLHRAIRTHRG